MVRASLSVCVLLAAAPSCPDLYSLATHGFSMPTVDIGSPAAGVDGSGLRVSAVFTAHNTNPFPLKVTSIDYQISLQGEVVSAGTQDDPEVPEHGQKSVTLSGALPSTSPLYRSLRPGQEVPVRVSGTAHVNSPAGVPVDVEFDGTGYVNLPSVLPAN